MQPQSRDGAPSLRTRTLSDALGVEIEGVSLRDLSQAGFDAIRDLWHAHLVVLLRDQSLDEEEQMAFGERFGGGALAAGHIPELHGAHEGVAYVSNLQKPGMSVILPDGEMQFHSDQCYRDQPSCGSMLYAIEIPAQGGNTMFANMYKAYETLPDDVKQRIADLKALNVYDYGLNPTQRGQPGDDAPRYVHPVVRTHPVTKRKALYVNRLMTARIEGLAPDESDALLAFLFDHAEQRAFVYEHVWRPGDALVWDNRCTLHARTGFDPAQRRFLRRISLPREPVY